ncbi:MAG: hypothetical protein EZS28_044628, partial [Streblomastix strix]
MEQNKEVINETTQDNVPTKIKGRPKKYFTTEEAKQRAKEQRYVSGSGGIAALTVRALGSANRASMLKSDSLAILL